MTKHTMKLLLKTLVTCLLCMVIVGCDGGIFGTGDSNDDLDLPDANAGISEGTDTGETANPLSEAEAPVEGDAGTGTATEAIAEPEPEPEPPEPPEPEPLAPGAGAGAGAQTGPVDPAEPSVTTDGAGANSVLEFDPETDVAVSSGSDLSFTNSFAVTDDENTELVFVNLTGVSVGIFSSNEPSNELNAEAVALTPAATTLAQGGVPENTSTLLVDAVDETGARTTLTTISPIDLAAGARTLIILRRIEPTVDIIVLPFVTGTVGLNAVAVRIVSTALIGDPQTASTFTLAQEISANDTTETRVVSTFDPVTFANPVTAYRFVAPSNFTLDDTAARFNNLPIDLNFPGRVVTIILDPSLPNQHLVLVDNP